ncbi:MAG: alkene reductase [Sulfurimicrobium sp.]|jgi:N-ethylmaleimide reductase|nr:alkene reductase [Sulfurimicrobium sp.]MDP1704419.1 alkene reductase [Sulfurimicrobium sp.]MDP2199105.1 alkene reductase [Sulfurimicrobium sp.]MDP2961775.1 alkene reductase [Sulfurimicrobium sp.]MDP3688064.1 alkene reductase [Sulfurimicrobium sp.]
MTDLFSPLRLGAIELANRVVMSPLTRCRAGAGNVPTDLMVEHYRQRASAGLIITEATPVCPEGHGYPRTPGIYTAEQIAGWKKVTQAVHAAGGKIVVQLWHVGRISHPDLQPDGVLPVAPSALRPAGQAFTGKEMKDFVTPRALETREIPGLIASYVQAARNAMEAGFDGVEIHAGNGYLLDQFLRSSTNQRADAYGGSKENRARLLLEVLDGVCAAIGSERVGVRLSPVTSFNDLHDEHPQETFEYVVSQLNRFNLAFLDLLQGTGGTPKEQWIAFDYGRLRSLYAGKLILNNEYDFSSAQEAVSSGAADAIAFGRLLLANPDLVERFRRGAPLNAPDYETLYGGEEKGYTDYPFLAG